MVVTGAGTFLVEPDMYANIWLYLIYKCVVVSDTCTYTVVTRVCWDVVVSHRQVHGCI